jgi:hypothetical protein
MEIEPVDRQVTRDKTRSLPLLQIAGGICLVAGGVLILAPGPSIADDGCSRYKWVKSAIRMMNGIGTPRKRSKMDRIARLRDWNQRTSHS